MSKNDRPTQFRRDLAIPREELVQDRPRGLSSTDVASYADTLYDDLAEDLGGDLEEMRAAWAQVRDAVDRLLLGDSLADNPQGGGPSLQEELEETWRKGATQTGRFSRDPHTEEGGPKS